MKLKKRAYSFAFLELKKKHQNLHKLKVESERHYEYSQIL